MKKVIVLALSATFLALGVSSCKKTTKRKLSNDWNVVKMDFNGESLDADGSRSNYSEVYSGNSITITDQSTNANGNTSVDIENGAVSEFTFTIDKDGTWKRNRDVKYIYSDGSTSQQIDENKGTWYFLGKNKGEKFKKNEKVLFYTNESSSRYIDFDGVTTTTSLNNNTYKGSEDGDIFTVLESKGKKLTFEVSFNATDTGMWGTDKWSGKIVYELEQK